MRGLLTLLASASLASAASAQTLHQVDLFSVSFSPQDLTIQQGDTVRWRWVVGNHNVVSGETDFQAYFPDGVFDSGEPVSPPEFFQVTFDGALLSKHPKAGNVYPYYCIVHLPAMIGTITVTGVSGSVEAYGPINPAGSLEFVQGNARLGDQMQLAIDNTALPAAGPGVALLSFSTAPDLNFPSGTLLPGYGLAGPTAPGELLISVAPPAPAFSAGSKPWNGTGDPATFLIPIPQNPALVGVDLYFQGALIDTANGNDVGLTNGLRATIGS